MSVDYSKNGMDPLVVRGEDFRRVIEPLIEEDGGNARPLADLIGVDVRALLAVVYHREYINLEKADRWLTKLGLQHLLSNGTLTVVANPRWNQERWIKWMRERGCEPDDG